MYGSTESLVTSLFNEIDLLTNRIRNIKQCFINTSNSQLKKRLINENTILIKRVNEISKIAILLNKKSIDKISLSGLLVEKSKRTLSETYSEKNLFYL